MTAQQFSITGGVVVVEDGLKSTEEYAPPRKVKVELHFSVPEGDNGEVYLSATGDIANKHVEFLLHKKVPLETTGKGTITHAAPLNAEVAKPPVTRAAEAAIAGDEKKKRGPKPKAAAELSDKDKLAQAAGVLETTVADDLDDGLGDLLGNAAPTPITDLELGKAAQEKNAKMKAELADKWAPAKIRELIVEYAGKDKRINDIPAAKRHEFLEKLNALK